MCPFTVVGILMLASPVLATEAAGPITMTRAIISNRENHTKSPVRLAWRQMSDEKSDIAGRQELPQRLVIRSAGKAGAVVGAALGSAAGLYFFGAPGGVLGAASGSVVGEVLGEWAASYFIRTPGPWLFRVNPRPVPGK